MVDAAITLEQITPPFRHVHRIIPSRFPPVGIFEQLGDFSAAEIRLLADIESRTNDRMHPELGNIHLVAPEDWVRSTPVMAAFTHPNPSGSRFSDGTFGVYYAAASLETAIAETTFHRTRFLRQTKEPPCSIDMRTYRGELCQPLLNGLDGDLDDAILDPDDYTESQRLGRALRNRHHWGLLYPSVRDPDQGVCAALFRPPAIRNVRQSKHLRYVFDGQSIARVEEIVLH